MKAFNQFSNADKARLLHTLFPDQMPGLIDFMQGMAETIREDQHLHRASWDQHTFSFDFWLGLASAVQAAIEKYNVKLSTNSRLFADQLFGGQLAIFAIHCILSYITVRRHKNTKFVKAADLLFGP